MPSATGPIGPRIVSFSAPGIGVRCLPADVEDVVSVHLSWTVPLAIHPGAQRIQGLVSGMLDRGTRRLSKQAFSEALEDTGAELAFSSRTGVLGARLRCLRRDAEALLGLLGECLRTPRFDADEIALLRKQTAAGLLRQRNQTGLQAARALARCLYTEGHPHYAWTVEDELAYLEQFDPGDVPTLWDSALRPTDVRAAIVGDVAPEEAENLVVRVLGGFPGTPPEHARHIVNIGAEGGTVHVPLADRMNLDVRMGHAVGMVRTHPDYDALYAGLFALGGNFSSRLMSTVRDRDGLTYGVRSGLSGTDMTWNGTWETAISLSSENLDLGIRRTREEIEQFVADGISIDEADAVASTLSGSFLVHLGTTGGLASTMLRHMERGLEPDEIDAYPERQRALSASDMTDAVRQWIDPSRLWVCSAGTRQ